MNIERWYNDFITDLSLKYNSNSTISMYSHNVKKFLIQFGHYREPKEIPTQEIKEYLLTFKTHNTRKQNLCAIKKFYELTVKMPNKVSKIPYPKKVKRLPKVIDSEYLIEQINRIPNKKHKAIIATAYSCSLRISEVRNLKRKDIDVKRMLVHINNSKGAKDRIVKLSDNLLKIIMDYGHAYHPTTYLFNGQNSLQYSVASLRNIVKKYIGEDYKFHTLRHSGATAMLENGTDITIIKDILGHNSIKTTQIYTHVSQKIIQGVNMPL